MKTERIIILAQPAFKTFLTSEAKAEGISVSELIRKRCKQQFGPDEQLLATLAQQLHLSNAAANEALDVALAALAQAQAAIGKLKAKASEAEPVE